MQKIVVTGTGRCGTSFLMQLFTELGLNTGYTNEEAEKAINKIDGLRAGIEHGYGTELYDRSHIIKNPEFAITGELNRILQNDGIQHVFIPIRKLRHTAASRAKMQKETHGHFGGFWMGSESQQQQEITHAKLLYDLMEFLALNNIQFTVMHFPTIASNPEYLYGKIKPVFGVSYGEFEDAFNKIADLGKVRFR